MTTPPRARHRAPPPPPLLARLNKSSPLLVALTAGVGLLLLGSLIGIGSQADVKCCIEAVQRRHSEAHRAAAAVVARLGFPNALRPARRTA